MLDFTRRRIVFTSTAARINEPPQINMSRIKIGGTGGIGMLAIAGLISVALPEIRNFIAYSVAFGFLTGIALIKYRAAHGPWHSDDGEHPLFDGHAGPGRGPGSGREDVVRRGTLSGLWPESHWRSWRRLTRGPASCIN